MKTIIHIFSSIDGRISGSFMGCDAAAGSRTAYARIRTDYAADAVLYGSVTALAFAGNPAPQPLDGVVVPEGDFLEHAVCAPGEEYVIVLDPQGEIWWRDPVLRRAGRPDARVIEVVNSATPKSFLAYLRNVGVPYLIAGDTNLDCAVMAEKLDQLLGINTLLVCGGGKTDWALLQAGCVDEVSVVFAPVASGEAGVATIFDTMPLVRGAHRQNNKDHCNEPIALSLQSVERVEGDGVHAVWSVR